MKCWWSSWVSVAPGLATMKAVSMMNFVFWKTRFLVCLSFTVDLIDMLGTDTTLRRELSIFLCPWNLHHCYALLLGATKYIILAPVRQWEVSFSCMDFEPSKFWMLCDRNFLPKKGLQHSCGYLKKQYWAIQWLHFVIDWHPFVEFLQRVVAWRYASVALRLALSILLVYSLSGCLTCGCSNHSLISSLFLCCLGSGFLYFFSYILHGHV